MQYKDEMTNKIITFNICNIILDMQDDSYINIIYKTTCIMQIYKTAYIQA